MLIKRAKYAGDIHEALITRCGWDIDTASYFLNSIPDAPHESLRPKGEWISHEGYEECKRCHTKAIYPHNFCPNCGADMRGTENER